VDAGFAFGDPEALRGFDLPGCVLVSGVRAFLNTLSLELELAPVRISSL